MQKQLNFAQILRETPRAPKKNRTPKGTQLNLNIHAATTEPLMICESTTTYTQETIRQIQSGATPFLNTPQEVAHYMKDAYNTHQFQEALYICCLNKKLRVICRKLISIGNIDSATVDIPAICRAAILTGATDIILCHNHPSGDPMPSAADIQITRHLRESLKLLNLSLKDHIIIGHPNLDPAGLGYYSFKEHGLI